MSESQGEGVRPRIRVAFLIPSFASGGAERVLIGFANGLPSERFETHLIVLSSQGPLRSDLDAGVALHDLQRPRVRQAMPALIRWIRSAAPDAVITSAPHLATPLMLARRLLPRRTRIVIREANLPSLHVADVRYPRLYRYSHARLYPKASGLIATSERMARELRSFGDSSMHVHVVPNPVDETHIRACANPPERRPGPGRRFVAVGRLVPQKGFDRLLDVVAELDASDHCTVIGEGAGRAALLARADDLGLRGRVEFPGFAENPWTFMAGADALLMPSRTEGLPNVALESLACGSPVIATPESGGIAEIAECAPEGAVTVVPIEGFVSHLVTVPPSPPESIRTSLLPDAYQVTNAVDALATVIEGVVE